MNEKIKPWYIAVFVSYAVILLCVLGDKLWGHTEVIWFVSIFAAPALLLVVWAGYAGICVETKIRSLTAAPSAYFISAVISAAAVVAFWRIYDGEQSWGKFIPFTLLVSTAIPALVISVVMFIIMLIRRNVIKKRRYEEFLAGNRVCFTQKRYIAIIAVGSAGFAGLYFLGIFIPW